MLHCDVSLSISWVSAVKSFVTISNCLLASVEPDLQISRLLTRIGCPRFTNWRILPARLTAVNGSSMTDCAQQDSWNSLSVAHRSRSSIEVERYTVARYQDLSSRRRLSDHASHKINSYLSGCTASSHAIGVNREHAQKPDWSDLTRL